MQTNVQRCHGLTQDAHMNGLVYNCLPSNVIFNFSPPISAEQASILHVDHLGFLFLLCWGISGKQMLPLSIDIQGIGLG